MSSRKASAVLELLPSYRAAIHNSVGTALFRNLYFRIGRTIVDVLDDGDLSCAVFVSSILYLFGLIPERHTTVKSTVEDMKKAGWYVTKRPRSGAVIEWGYRQLPNGGQGKHRHLGFYVDASSAVSNDSIKRTISKHHLTFGTKPNGTPRREIIAYYWNDKLNKRRLNHSASTVIEKLPKAS
ncbi:hypothetical protein KGM48_02315 [Patescibacteria group bacterium]|nr:hypothetical protein [Patescibacteria group bacterium]